MKHDKRRRDADRETMFSDMDVPKRSPPPSASGRSWCADQSFYPRQNHFNPDGVPERKKLRCPSCRRIVLLQEVHCVGGELVGFKIPMHKTKPRTFKRPSRVRRHANRR